MTKSRVNNGVAKTKSNKILIPITQGYKRESIHISKHLLAKILILPKNLSFTS